MNKFLTVIILALTLHLTCKAQQFPLLSQYMFNGLVLNPAYAGSKPFTSASIDIRKQWAGFEGSPTTQAATIHGLTDSKKVGLGFMISNDKVGIQNQTDVFGSYAFHISQRRYKFSLGLQAGFSYLRSQISDLKYWQNGDPVYALNTLSNVQPNVGFGAYLYSEMYYAGISAPYLLSYDPLQGGSFELEQSHHVARHIFFTSGYVISVTEQIKLKPSVLAKYIYASPTQFDLNLNVLLNNIIWVGASYRTNDAIVAIGEYQLTKKLRIGYSFDFTLSEIQKHSAGSHEFMIGYDFGYKLQKVKTPRYF